jgi:hypothetical protein
VAVSWRKPHNSRMAQTGSQYAESYGLDFVASQRRVGRYVPLIQGHRSVAP